MTALSIGDRFGDYQITAHIGAGGMGEVFRARDHRLGRDVAIKVLPPHLAADPGRRARFEREARFLAALSHPHIGGIHGFVSVGDVNGLALEFIDGPDLSDKIASGPLSVAQTLAIARQIAAALDAAHERGIIHRDLKPANIKIAADGNVKVLDFGIAKALTSPGDEATTTAEVTNAGTVLGTIGYMSPEQTRGQEVDRRTDIWAFGCIVFEMLTGRPPFAGPTTSDTIAAILQRDPDWSQLPADTPPRIARMLRRCLQKDVRQRQRDIADAAADMDEIDMAASRTRGTGWRSWTGWIGSAIAGAAVTAALLSARGRAPAPAIAPRASLDQVTFDASVSMMPALSPDGKLLAYASDRAGRGDLDLWVEQTAGGAPIRLTDDPADDLQPAFSPDGSQIVFRSERAGGGVYVIPALGGNARRVADGGRSPRFSPDGHHIAYWTGPWRGNVAIPTGSAFTLDLSGGEPTRILPAFTGVREPMWSPDGKSLLVLAREKNESPIDLYSLQVDSGTVSKTGAFDRYNFLEDISGQHISATVLAAWTRAGVLVSASSGLWLLPVSSGAWASAGAPRQMTVGGGRHIYATADDTGAIVLTIAEAPRVIERAPLNNDGPPELLYTDGNAGGSRPSQTADGSRIIYDRRGAGFAEIWIKQRGVDDRMVVRTTEQAGNSVISPDGTRVAYTVGPDGGAGEGFTVNVEGGVPARLCVDCTVWGFLANSSTILVTDQGATRLRAVDVRTASSRIIVESPSSLTRPHISPDDRNIAFNVAGQQWIAAVYPDRPTPQIEWHRVQQDTVTARACGWSIDSQTAYLLLDTDGFRCLWGQRVDPRNGTLLGAPFAVRHFHKTVMQEFSTSFGNAISAKGFLYGGGRLKANLWRLTVAAR